MSKMHLFTTRILTCEELEQVEFTGRAEVYSGSTASSGDDPDLFDIYELDMSVQSHIDTYDMIGSVSDSIIERLIEAHSKGKEAVTIEVKEMEFTPQQWKAIVHAASEE